MRYEMFLDKKELAEKTGNPQIAVSDTGMRYIFFPDGTMKVKTQKISETLFESVLNECLVTPFNSEC